MSAVPEWALAAAKQLNVPGISDEHVAAVIASHAPGLLDDLAKAQAESKEWERTAIGRTDYHNAVEKDLRAQLSALRLENARAHESYEGMNAAYQQLQHDLTDVRFAANGWRETAENKAALISKLDEYIQYLAGAEQQMAGLMLSHGWAYPKETITHGERLRAEIALLRQPSTPQATAKVKASRGAEEA